MKEGRKEKIKKTERERRVKKKLRKKKDETRRENNSKIRKESRIKEERKQEIIDRSKIEIKLCGEKEGRARWSGACCVVVHWP